MMEPINPSVWRSASETPPPAFRFCQEHGAASETTKLYSQSPVVDHPRHGDELGARGIVKLIEHSDRARTEQILCPPAQEGRDAKVIALHGKTMIELRFRHSWESYLAWDRSAYLQNNVVDAPVSTQP